MTTCNLEKAIETFGVSNILEKDAIVGDQIGTVFFASMDAWNEQRLMLDLKFSAVISDKPFRHPTFGCGWAVFVPDEC
ncbi:MAG: hypothetical protein IKP28_05760 [Clostridia bacterium]|nr:hypothetical protein [Clostridia bacterium]